jgi:very-short-patch-repair endonuclease
LHLAKRTCRDISREVNIGYGSVIRILNQSGYDTSFKLIQIPIDKILPLHNKGIGVKGIGKILGVSFRPIERILKEHGIKPRNRHEQQQARMDNTSIEDRKKLVKNANTATRGRPKNFDEISKMAKTHELNQTRKTSSYETLIFNELKNKGFDLAPQTAIGKYNCDFTIGSVAVEVLGGNWHWYGEHMARFQERTRYILNSGYHIIFVCINKTYPFDTAITDYLASFLEFSGSNPTIDREYRVIWGTCKNATRTSINSDNFTLIRPFKD